MSENVLIMDQWASISSRFNEWGSPLRPCDEDVEMFKREIKPGDRVLLLGVTQELMPFANVIVDHNPSVIENFGVNAVLGDWAALPFDSEFDVVIGDGCLTVFQESPEKFFEQVKKVLKPNGRFVLRVFSSPESKEDLEDVLTKKDEMEFHAFKWRVAQSLANPYVSVQEIYRAIQPVWNHPTLEVYRDSDWIYYFPKLSELPKWSHIQFGSSYELAERCPVVTWQFDS